MKKLATFSLILMAATACTKEVPRVTRGTRLVEGAVTGLYRSPGGDAVATLVDAQPARDPGAPRDLVTGSLHLASTTGSGSQRLGGGVTNLPDALAFSPDGRWLAFLSGYSIPRARGELQLVKVPDGQPETLAPAVSFYAFSADGSQIAWVADGQLFLRPVSGGEAKVVTEGVATVEFGPKDTPASRTLLIRRGLQSGGTLLAYDIASGTLRAIARGTRTFAFAPNGDIAFQAESLLKPDQFALESVLARKAGDAPGAPALYLASGQNAKRLSDESVTEFRFSSDGGRLAFLTPPRLGQPAGDLWLFDGQETKRVTTRVQSFSFGRDGSLVLLGAWEASASAGTLGVYSAAGDLREIARTVKQFTLSPKGGTVLFSQLVPINGVYSLGLSLQAIDAPADATPRQVGVGVYGYTVDANEQHLAYKSNCLEDAKACTLYVTDLGPAGDSRELARRVAAFEFIPGRSDLAVVTSRHAGKHDPRLVYTLATASMSPGKDLTLLDDRMTGHFLVAKDRLVWLVSEEGREGLYAAPFELAAR